MTLITMIFFINTVNVHMKIKSLISFSTVTFNNSSFTKNESDFLCKQLYDESNADVLAKNIMIIDTFQTLSFIDSTIHEDRSC